MAKKYISKISKSGQTLYLKDIEAQEAMLIPVDISTLTPSSTFIKNNALAINGKLYRALRNTSNFPVILQADNNQFVIVTDNEGNEAFVITDATLNEDWEVWGDAGVAYHIHAVEQSISNHINAMTRHITASERTAWNTVSDKANKASGSGIENHVAALTSDGGVKSTPLTVDATTGELNTERAIRIVRGNRTFSFDPVYGGTLSDVNIDMGWNWTNRDGSGAAFRSSDSSLGAAAGQFHFWARDAENSTVLVGSPNGNLTWGGKNISTSDDLATKADLDINGKVPSSQLPSYVDDVVEYENRASFPETGEAGKIYVNKAANTTYRWTGTTYALIKGDLALGETDSTAYRGDRGKIAYDHSQDSTVHVTAEQKTAWTNKQDAISNLSTIESNAANGNTAYGWGNHAQAGYASNSDLTTHTGNDDIHVTATQKTTWSGKQDAIDDLSTIRSNASTGATHAASTHARTDATKTEASTTNGNIKINGTETTVYTHPSTTAQAAAAKKVGTDALGHVVIGDTLTPSDINAASQTDMTAAEEAIDDINDALGEYSSFIDLGLPSGKLWAKCNLGATNETEYGNYYTFADSLTADYGGLMRQPTKEEWQEVISNTISTWVTNYNNSGINGRLFTASNGNSLFLPASGTYYNGTPSGQGTSSYAWTSTPDSSSGYGVRAASDAFPGIYTYYENLPVRPIVKASTVKGVIDGLSENLDNHITDENLHTTPAEKNILVEYGETDTTIAEKVLNVFNNGGTVRVFDSENYYSMVDYSNSSTRLTLRFGCVTQGVNSYIIEMRIKKSTEAFTWYSDGIELQPVISDLSTIRTRATNAPQNLQAKDVYVAVTSTTGKNPATEGWYEIVNNEYVATADTTPASGKTYYQKKAYKELTWD